MPLRIKKVVMTREKQKHKLCKKNSLKQDFTLRSPGKTYYIYCRFGNKHFSHNRGNSQEKAGVYKRMAKYYLGQIIVNYVL